MRIRDRVDVLVEELGKSPVCMDAAARRKVFEHIDEAVDEEREFWVKLFVLLARDNAAKSDE